MSMNGFYPTPYQNSKVAVFTGWSDSADITTADTQYYSLPPEHTMAYFILIGGGSGGGGGCTRAAGVAGGGGGGGGSGAITKALIPTILLPRTLNIYPGRGGLGGAAGANGQSGSLSYIAAGTKTVSVNNLLLKSGTAAGSAGTTGLTAGGSGTAGLGETIGTNASMYKGAALGIISYLEGQAGATGGSTGNGTQIAWPTTGLFISGGAGGAGINTGNSPGAGGPINSGYTDFTHVNKTIIGGTGGASGGTDGMGLFTPLSSGVYATIPHIMYAQTGGSGGGASGTSGVGGRGGNGGYGCGGGGGGAGITGGMGGDGGPGLIIIISW